MKIIENHYYKICSSPMYNFIFNKQNGVFGRWGATPAEDPEFSPYGPEILDLEISVGKCVGCDFCLPRDTIISTPDGERDVQDIVVGDYVIGYNISNNNIQIQEVLETHKREYVGDMIYIELENGRTLRCTPEHNVYTEQDGWVLAKNLCTYHKIKHF